MQEYWVVDVAKRQIQVFDFSVPLATDRIFRGTETFESRLLPEFRPHLDQLFEELDYLWYDEEKASGQPSTSDASSRRPQRMTRGYDTETA